MQFEIGSAIFKLNLDQLLALTNLSIGDAILISCSHSESYDGRENRWLNSKAHLPAGQSNWCGCLDSYCAPMQYNRQLL